MKLIALLATAVIVLCIAAPSADAKDIRKESQFLEAIVGKKLVNGGTWLVISPDGKLEGVAPNNVKIKGAWVWNKKFWCRNVVAGQKSFPEDCLKVSVDGNQVKFVRNKGKGDAISYTIAD
ncbi:MAG: hypothetical protein AB3N19_15400 [Ruegeria sp.]